ncbi:LOW QUALITY PROTEIN: embigin [Anomaloglossus baeobatrachus]|uniref:LOW QUALITY PROTEIN: embigin n=1 Tax=Anomaloglossus baeobatrachus TaxID=238106 RepID=UPI003F5019A0
MIHHITQPGTDVTSAERSRGSGLSCCTPLLPDMRLSALHPLLVPVFCGILSVASPGITSYTAGLNVTPLASVHNQDGFNNHSIAEHSISIAGFSTKENSKTIVMVDPLRLKLECDLVVDPKDLQVNVSWRHEDEQISSNLYTYNNREKQWSTTYEFVMTDVNKTGNYTCIFSSATEINGTFSVQVPPVHGGSKSFVSYIGDHIDLKCDTSTNKPQNWLWYKVTENGQVQLNFSLDPKRYEDLSEKRNETKLRITNLSESDSGRYVCKAVFKAGESEGEVDLKVLSYLVPLKVFLVIAAEVVILVSVIGIYEVMSKKKRGEEDIKKDYEQMAQIKSEDSSIAEASTTRQRK